MDCREIFFRFLQAPPFSPTFFRCENINFGGLLKKVYLCGLKQTG